MSRNQLISELVTCGYLKTPRIIEAFKAVDRKYFVPRDLRGEAYVNSPLPIGFGQTISQPLTVAFMLELLAPNPGDKVLDVGAGSGWQAALLAHIVGLSGQVYALEIIPELKAKAEQNLNMSKFKHLKIVLLCADAHNGLAKFAPFNKIIGAAASTEIPPALLKQLAPGGRMVFPVNDALVLGQKDHAGKTKFQKFPGFRFVPLV